jgi:hypothetical protein
MSRGIHTRRRVVAPSLTTTLVVALIVLGLAGPALAVDGFNVTIPIDTVVQNVPDGTAPEGSITPLQKVQVPEENLGERCAVAARSQNQDSVHPANNLIVESGSSMVVIPDVEAVAGGTVDADGELTLGSEIDVSLQMGPDEVFSAGIVVVIDCTAFRGRIIVVKEVASGSSTTESFEFTASYDSDGFSLADGEQDDSGLLRPGTYSVSEDVPDGWTLQSASCSDQSAADAIDLSAGETVTCTFTNGQSNEVGASIVVTVDSSCDVVEGDSQLDINVSVDGGATVTVTDSNGSVVASVTEDTAIPVTDGATYTWEATPNEGFEFPAGSATSGTITIEDCSVATTLPFTGAENALAFALVATFLVGSGVSVLVFSWRQWRDRENSV